MFRFVHRYYSGFAGLLAFVMWVSWSRQPLHILFEHEHDHHRQACALSYEAKTGEFHFHDEHFLEEDCDQCAFTLTVFEQPEWIFSLGQTVLYVQTPAAFFYSPVALSFSGDNALLRGPPAV